MRMHGKQLGNTTAEVLDELARVYAKTAVDQVMASESDRVYGEWLNAAPAKTPQEWNARRRLVIQLLEAHANGSAALPGDVAFELLMALRELEAGKRPRLLWPARRQGRTRSAEELSLVVDAVAYVLAGQERGRRATVAHAYGVSRKSVDEWVRRYRADGDSLLTRLRSRFTRPEQLTRVLVTLRDKSGARFVILGATTPPSRRIRQRG